MQWINANLSGVPPDCMNVLLYITMYHHERLFEETFSDVYSGFYDHDNCKYYIDTISSGKIEIENERVKVIAWAFIPRIPNYVRKWIKHKS